MATSKVSINGTALDFTHATYRVHDGTKWVPYSFNTSADTVQEYETKMFFYPENMTVNNKSFISASGDKQSITLTAEDITLGQAISKSNTTTGASVSLGANDNLFQAYDKLTKSLTDSVITKLSGVTLSNCTLSGNTAFGTGAKLTGGELSNVVVNSVANNDKAIVNKQYVDAIESALVNKSNDLSASKAITFNGANAASFSIKEGDSTVAVDKSNYADKLKGSFIIPYNASIGLEIVDARGTAFDLKDLIIGDNLLIVETTVPDFFVSAKTSTYVQFSPLEAVGTGVLNTNNTTSTTMQPKADESLGGMIYLHKVSKTGKLFDLTGMPSSTTTKDLALISTSTSGTLGFTTSAIGSAAYLDSFNYGTAVNTTAASFAQAIGSKDLSKHTMTMNNVIGFLKTFYSQVIVGTHVETVGNMGLQDESYVRKNNIWIDTN